MISAYKIRIRSGRAFLTGEEIIGKRRHKKYQYKETYITDTGNFSQNEWMERVAKEIEKEGKTDLLQKIIDHCKTHCAWLHKEEEFREYAMECLCSEAYKYWDDFTISEDAAKEEI